MSKKYRIEYLPIAQEDITEIFEYILADNPSAAASIVDAMDTSIAKLMDFPLLGVIPDDPRLKQLGYRILVIGNYLIFYVILPDEIVEIRRVLHGKRRYAFLL